MAEITTQRTTSKELQTMQPASIVKAMLDGGEKTMQQLDREPDSFVRLRVLTVVESFLRSINIKHNMVNGNGANQVDELVAYIVTNYKHWTVDDVVLFFHRCKFGRYGKVFDRMDSNVLGAWLAMYDTERDSALADYHTNKVKTWESEARELPADQQVTDERLAEILQPLYDKARLKERKRKQLKEHAPDEKQERMRKLWHEYAKDRDAYVADQLDKGAQAAAFDLRREFETLKPFKTWLQEQGK